MNKQRKVLITITYNEMRIIVDTKAEEVAQPSAKDTNVPITDTISRREAMDVLHGYFDGMLETDTVCPADIYGLFECIPPARQWIPCSERLPEEEKAYLVTFANEKVGMSSWHKDTLYNNRGFDAYLTGVTEDGECEYFGVVAWMEKPEPWKGGPDEH